MMLKEKGEVRLTYHKQQLIVKETECFSNQARWFATDQMLKEGMLNKGEINNVQRGQIGRFNLPEAATANCEGGLMACEGGTMVCDGSDAEGG